MFPKRFARLPIFALSNTHFQMVFNPIIRHEIQDVFLKIQKGLAFIAMYGTKLGLISVRVCITSKIWFIATSNARLYLGRTPLEGMA